MRPPHSPLPLPITLVQSDIAWEDPASNFAHIRDLLSAAPPTPGGILVLPEMFPTGFSFNREAVANAAKPARDFLHDLAKETQCLTLGGVASTIESTNPNPSQPWGRNEAFAFNPAGTELVRYRKVRTFSYTEEAKHFERGREIIVFEYAGWKICPLICYDLRFPELFRAGLDQGADLFVVIANWPSAREDHWVTLLRARAIENQAFVIGVNRSGTDPKYNYSGRSLAIDPHGAVLADAGNAPGAHHLTLDREALLSWRSEFPAWRDSIPPTELNPPTP
ncbi:MAG: omega-amidase [Verrucomicrobiales bacterium]|jgi:omega-amidase